MIIAQENIPKGSVVALNSNVYPSEIFIWREQGRLPQTGIARRDIARFENVKLESGTEMEDQQGDIQVRGPFPGNKHIGDGPMRIQTMLDINCMMCGNQPMKVRDDRHGFVFIFKCPLSCKCDAHNRVFLPPSLTLSEWPPVERAKES